MIAWCKDVDKGLGRAMKVTKEMATGLYKAIEKRYVSKEAIDSTPYQKALNGVIDTRITKKIQQDEKSIALSLKQAQKKQKQ